MKKILALVLALVMTLSLATISSGAAYSDADSIRYADAVNTLTALGVVQGTGTGFDPAGDVTRGAAAKMVAMVATGSNKTTLSYYAGTSAFADVPATNVFADAVAFCVARGIVDGYGNGMYGVKDNVKGWAIAKMVLVAMGYDAEAYGLTGAGASLNTITLASSIGLFNGMEADFVATAAASREECAQIVYNALTLNGVKKSSVSSDGVTTYGASGKCLMQNYAFYANDAMTGVDGEGEAWSNFGTPAIDWLVADMVEANQATGYWYTAVDGGDLNVETGLDLIGHVVGFVPTTLNAKTDAYGAPYYDVFAVVDLSSTVEVATALSTEKAVTAAFGKTTALDGTIVGFENYAIDQEIAPDLDADEASVGTYVIYDEAVVSYLVNDFSVGYVSDYSVGTSKLDGKITVNDVDYALITSDLSKEAGYTTMVTYYDDIAEGDVVIVQPCGDLTTITKAETVSGVVTAVATSKAAVPSITVGGKTYAKSSDYVASGLGLTLKGNLSANMVNADVTMYLDPNGAVFAIMDTPDATNDAGLAYVVKTWTKETAGSYNEDAYVEYFVQAVDMTGAVVNYQTAPACDIETEGHECDSSCDNYGGASVGDLMSVTTSYSDITKTTVANFGGAATGAKINNDCDEDLTAYSLKFGAKDYFASDVKFIYVSGSGSTLKVTVKDGVQAVKTNNMDYYAVQVGTSENYNVKYVVVPTGYTASAVTSTDVVYANETRASYESESYTDVNGDAQKAFVHYVYINGVYTKVLTAKSTAISGFKTYSIDANGLYVFKALNEKVDTGVVSNLYGTLLTLDVEGLADIEAKDAKIVDTVYAAMTDAEKAAAEEITTLAQLAEEGVTVAVVYNMDATETYATDFVTIYVVDYANASIGGAKYASLEDAIAAAKNGDTITLEDDVVLSSYLTIGKNVTIDLNGNDITRADGTALYVNGATVTIQGEGTVSGDQAVYVSAGQVDIRGGSYHSDGDTIYVTGTGKVKIYAGVFSADESDHTADTYCVLNQLDSSRLTSSITVYGGTFVGFDPANNASEGPNTNFVAPGYASEAGAGNTYTVKQAPVLV